MAFDLNKLMADPMFQAGLATLGGAVQSPGLLNAYQALQARKKMELEEQDRASQRALEQERSKLYAEQVKAQQRNLAIQERRDQALMDFIKRRQQPASTEGLGGDRGAPGVPIQPQQPALSLPPTQPAAQPPEPVGKYGTPLRHLDRLMQIESSGNPNAVGPLLPEGDRALGPFQFRPGTINQLKKEGIVFNPFNIEQSRDAADFYIQKLLKENEGDYAKAYAAYGGFKSKDPSKYVTGIMGSPEKQAQASAQASNLSAQSAKYKQLQSEAGTLQLLTGDMSGLKTLVEAEKPDYEAAKLGVSEKELAIKQTAEQRHAQELEIKRQQEARIADEATRKRVEDKTQDWRSFASTSANLDNFSKKIQELSSHPGLERIYGLSGAIPDIPGTAAADARALQVSVTKQLAKETLQAVREASKTGGAFGNVSDKDVELLETSVQNLGKAQSPEAAKKAMREVQTYSGRIRNIAMEAYERQHNESPIQGLPLGARYAGVDPQSGKSFYKLPNGKFVREE